MRQSTRREFIANSLVLSGLLSLPPTLLAARPDERLGVDGGVPKGPGGRQNGSLDADEMRFTEAMVRFLCPSDGITPDGESIGLARAIDRLLSGDYGSRTAEGARLNRGQQYKVGVAAVNEFSIERFGVGIDRLTAEQAASLMHQVRAGRITARGVELDRWSTTLVDPLLARACFSGSVERGYGAKAFWKLFSPTGARR